MAANEYSTPIGPWQNKVRTAPVRLITKSELQSWILFENERLLILNKPGDVVCHPSKDGPWSSLVGAAREYLGLAAIHLVFRLDRETSGVVLLAKDSVTARRLQMGAQDRRYAKEYFAILSGELPSSLDVNQPLGPDYESVVNVKSRVVLPGEGQLARTLFVPWAASGGFTLAKVTTETGRKHQIRAHAQWAGFPLVGDKIYGPDARLYLDFVEHGWTPALAHRLLLPRQALHCASIDLRPMGESHVFNAPLPEDLRAFCRDRMGQILTGDFSEVA